MSETALVALRQALIDHALSLPEAWEDHPWGEVALKVRKKVFVFLGSVGEDGFNFSVKLPHNAMEVLQEPFAEPMGYGLGRSGWVSVRLRSGEEVPEELVLAWVEESYRAVAPKRLSASIGA